MMMNIALSEDRDVPLLLFLWKWKVATTLTLARRFFPKAKKAHTAYKRIHKLWKAGFIARVPVDQGLGVVWMLEKRGFQAVREHIPGLSQEGYKSESPRHDLYAMAIHLGEWLKSSPEKAVLFSEQQIRRYDPECYPSWVPKIKNRCPDGFWRVERVGKMRVIALEVELSRKTERDYKDIAHAYGNSQGVDFVLWAVRSDATAQRMSQIFRSADCSQHVKHNFMRVQDFESKGWDAPIILGSESEKSVSEFLGHSAWDKAGTTLGQGWDGCPASSLIVAIRRP